MTASVRAALTVGAARNDRTRPLLGSRSSFLRHDARRSKDDKGISAYCSKTLEAVPTS